LKSSSRIRCHHLLKTFYTGWTETQYPDGPGFGRAFSGLTPVAATVVAAAHPRVAAAHPGPAGAILRRRDVVRIVGDVALTVDYYLTGRASCVSRLGDGGGCADDCGYRKPCANREE